MPGLPFDYGHERDLDPSYESHQEVAQRHAARAKTPSLPANPDLPAEPWQELYPGELDAILNNSNVNLNDSSTWPPNLRQKAAAINEYLIKHGFK